MKQNSILIHLENVWKIYKMGEVEVPALKGVTVEIKKGDLCYRDGKRWLGKKLDYWKNAKTALKPGSTSALLHFEFLPPVSPTKQKEVIDEAVGMIKAFCGGKTKIIILSKKNNSVLLK